MYFSNWGTSVFGLPALARNPRLGLHRAIVQILHDLSCSAVKGRFGVERAHHIGRVVQPAIRQFVAKPEGRGTGPMGSVGRHLLERKLKSPFDDTAGAPESRVARACR